MTLVLPDESWVGCTADANTDDGFGDAAMSTGDGDVGGDGGETGDELRHVSSLHVESDVLDDPIREARTKEVEASWADEDGTRLVGRDPHCGCTRWT